MVWSCEPINSSFHLAISTCKSQVGFGTDDFNALTVDLDGDVGSPWEVKVPAERGSVHQRWGSLGSGRDTKREDGARETSHNWQKQQKVGGGWK